MNRRRSLDDLDLPCAVVVSWVDHFDLGAGTWVRLADVGDEVPMPVISCAWLIRCTDDVLTLCQSVTEGGDGRGVFVVVRAAVQNWRAL